MSREGRQLIRLLFVEDDEDDYVLTTEMLERSELLDFEIEWARDAAAARRLLAQKRHDICLMDYRLGADSGVNLVRDAVKMGFSAPIIMLTGQDDTGVEIEAAEAGAVDFLVKDNLSLEQLQRSIRYALARSEIQAERFERLRAESASRSKSEFLANLSHEIRTPLTAILGYTELLIDEYRDADGELVERLSVIDRNGIHLLSLLNDTLDLSKIEAGKFEIEKRSIELGPFLADLMSLIRVSAEEKGLDFEEECLTALPDRIETDGMRLRQILLNLLGNAVKFTDRGSVRLEMELKKVQTRWRLLFHVQDSGQGIEPDHLQHIFDPFTQLSSGARLLKGTGLGLTISLKLAQNLGGGIEVRSTPGRGSRFSLSIDPGSLETASIGPLNLARDDSPSHIRHIGDLCGKVLVVDDVEDIRSLIGSILEKAGVECGFATDGREAVQLLAGGDGAPEYTLVLMDLNMPVMNGFQAMREMRRRGVRVPAIALTAASLQGEREKCMAEGYCGYISKPITASNLVSAIAESLQRVARARAHGGGEAAREGGEEGGGQRVLVVEDNADANQALCMLLQHLGHETETALGVKEALANCEGRTPAIVLADLNLPDGSGLELVAAVHARCPETRIFVVSGEQAGQESLPDYIEDRLVKPVTLEALRTLLGEATPAPS